MLTLGGKPLQVPILQGGMGVGVSLGGLAGAVAACGGMGCISTADAGYREPDFARDPAAANHRALTAEIQKAKAIAGGMGLVAINAMVATRDYADAIRTAVAAGVDAVVSGAGLPLELPGIVGTKEVAIAPIVSSARAAKLILRRWAKGFDRTADFVVIEGCKAGGHLGFAEEDLLADRCQTLDEILPGVLAEGKRFPPKHCARCLKTCDPAAVPYCITHALIEAVKGNVEEGLFFCGENVGRLDRMRTVRELMDELVTEWRQNL